MTATARTRIKAKLVPRWPASVYAGDLINIAQVGTAYTISFTMNGVASDASPPSTFRFLGFNPVDSTYKYVTRDNLATAIGAAPTSASYLVLGANASLTNERVLTAGTGFSFADLGANSTLTINFAANGVSNAFFRQSAGLSIVGRSANTTGDVADITAVTDGHVLRLAGTSIGFGTVATAGIADAAVTLAKMANVATASFFGRVTAGTGVPEAMTGTQATTLLDTFTSLLKGLVPASGGGSTNYLRADLSWASPPGTAATPLYAGFVNNMEITASVAASALTVALKTDAGTDPAGGDAITMVFPSATEASGAITSRSLTAASSIVAASTTTLGTANSTAFRFWLVMFDDAGTLRLALINCRTSAGDIYPLGGWGVASAVNGSGSSAHVFYSNATITSKPYIVLGYVEYNATGLATAGTYASGPTRIRIHQRGMMLPGDVVQFKHGTYATNADLTTIIPFDDSIPQDTEGTQLVPITFQNDSAANINQLFFSGFGGPNSGGPVALAAFSSASVNALHVDAASVSAGLLGHFSGERTVHVNSAASLTWQLRGGGSTGLTVRFNGTQSSRNYGGLAAVTFRVVEIMS